MAAGLAGAVGAVGVAGAVVVGTGVGGTASAPTPVPGVARPPGTGPEGPVRLHTRWRERPDGPIPTHGDEGVALSVIALQGRRPTVAGGALVGHLPASTAATYVTQPLETKMQLIGAEFGFGPGSQDGAVGLIAMDPERALTSHCHIAISPTRWVAATVADGDLSVFAEGRLPRPLAQDGRPHRAECRVAGDRITLTLPDGSQVSARDEAVARLPGRGACWEFYRDSGDGADVRFYETWAR